MCKLYKMARSHFASLALIMFLGDHYTAFAAPSEHKSFDQDSGMNSSTSPQIQELERRLAALKEKQGSATYKERRESQEAAFAQRQRAREEERLAAEAQQRESAEVFARNIERLKQINVAAERRRAV
jgi:hypothetical protein